MKLFRSKQEVDLEQAISELRAQEPDAKMLSVSAERVWKRLQTGDGAEVATSAVQLIRGCADIRSLLPAFHRQELPCQRSQPAGSSREDRGAAVARVEGGPR